MERTLFVGVGGSGGETVRFVMRELDRRLRASGWNEGLPSAWQFVHIDVREEPDDVKSTIPAALNARLVHVGLGRFPFEYDHYASKLTANPAIKPGVEGWLPAPDSSQSPPWTGAGQRRAVGRAVAAAELGVVADLLASVTQQMSTGDADQQLLRLATHLNSAVTVGAANGLVFVINSLGGGAGSGAFLDVIQLLRAQSGSSVWLSKPYSVVYAPDVFKTLPDSGRRGIEANSLAAICELMHAYTHTGPIEQTDSAVLQAAGGGLALSNRTGPEAVLVVGASNGANGIAFTEPTQVYESVGKALATLVASESVASQFDAYVRSNFGSASPPLTLPLSLQGQPNPVSSLGYASVSLGKDLFADYVTERLANAVLERLRDGYLEGVDRSAFFRAETLIDTRAESDRENFFRESGLWEIGKDHNQVLDALRDAGAKRAALDELRDKVLKKTVTHIPMSVTEWIQRINSAFDADAKKFAEDEARTRQDNAVTWIVKIQGQLLTATVESVSRNGFDVTVKLLDLLASQIEDAERGLQKEREDHGIRERKYLDSLALHFQHLKARAKAKLNGDASAEPFRAAAQARRDALSDRTESDLRQLAHDLLVDVRRRLLPPIKAVVNTMATSLNEDLKVPEVKQVAAQWSGTSVSKHLQPTPNEVLLIPAATFPRVFSDVLSAMFEAPINDALGEALEEIIRGGWPSDDNVNGGPQTLVHVTAQWQPDVSVVRASGQAVRSAEFSSLLTAKRIHELAGEWVRGRRGALGDYINETLGEWLTAAPGEQGKRGNEFRTALASALTRGRPLLSVDGSLSQRVHGSTPGKPIVLISPIPMDSQHPARIAVEALIASEMPQSAAAAQAFGVTTEDSVEVVTFPGGTVHPIVVSSLTSPIQDEWVSRRANPVSRSDFWEYRRARTLSSFVPLPPALQEALLQGWLIAQLLGHLNVSDLEATIWTPYGERSFPSTLLTRPAKPEQLLPALLESYPLALLSFASGTDSELEAYNELIRLGSETSGVGALVPSIEVSDALTSWVQDGKTAAARSAKSAGAAAPKPEVAGTAADAPSDRAAAMTAALEQVIAKVTAVDGAGGHEPRLELRALYVGGAAAIRATLQSLVAEEATASGLI